MRLMKVARLNIACVVFLLLARVAHAAEQQVLPWRQAEVVKASILIGMTEEQIPQFKETVSHYLSAVNSAVIRVRRGNDQSDIARKIKRKTSKLRKAMDKEMAEFLTATQMPKYIVYRDLLLARMVPGR